MPVTPALNDRSEKLPVDALRDGFRTALDDGPVVVTSPTGSGKSTRVPLWCPPPVLVVEPRRVACRGLAQRVAELAGQELGAEVGYHVRDERRAGDATRVLYATPGVALRLFDDLDRFATVVLDEFHERSLDVDLLLALLGPSYRGRRVVMSATLEGERVAAYLGGRHLHAEGRVHPVEVRHRDGGTLLPDARGLEARVLEALEATRERPGDVLVFLPGKAEIASCARALAGLDADVVPLHGGLTLAEQSRAFQPSPRRKVVLATNVAETSITLPGIAVVVDSGLVRRTRYHRGRGFLTLGPIALDSAEQRAGRAGRTRPGVAVRLWSAAAQLEARTPPEIHREGLEPLVLAAAACGARVENLVFLDPPREHAVAAARDELRALDALDDEGRLTECGRQLFGLPLDAPLGRLLVEARTREGDEPGVLDDMIDLVAALAPDRPLLGSPPADEDDEDDRTPCDATDLVRAVRQGPRKQDRRHPELLREARRVRARLRRAFERPGEGPRELAIDRRRLALTVLGADPRAAHVARRRGRRVAWSNGGTEIELGRQSAVRRAEDAEAIVVLETRAIGGRETKTLVTCAMPVPLAWLLEAGLGRDRLAGVEADGGRAVARVERVYARRVLAMREEVPEGRLARRAVAELYLRGSIFSGGAETARERLRLASLARQVLAASPDVLWAGEVTALFPDNVPELAAWVESRLATLGVESGDDLALLTADDLLPPTLPEWARAELDRAFPRSLELAGAAYEIDYDVPRREAILRQVRGRPHQLPPAFALPQLPGFAIRIEHRGTLRTLRERG